jgi:hypothetical protein
MQRLLMESEKKLAQTLFMDEKQNDIEWEEKDLGCMHHIFKVFLYPHLAYSSDGRFDR